MLTRQFQFGCGRSKCSDDLVYSEHGWSFEIGADCVYCICWRRFEELQPCNGLSFLTDASLVPSQANS